MIPAWHLADHTNKTWLPCWLISTSPHGSGEGRVLVAFDDTPHPAWGYPNGSLRISSVDLNDIRLRRTVIPLFGGAAPILPDKRSMGDRMMGCGDNG